MPLCPFDTHLVFAVGSYTRGDWLGALRIEIGPMQVSSMRACVQYTAILGSCIILYVLTSWSLVHILVYMISVLPCQLRAVM